jgi:substrate import-associated zinc metallohydrolase lipoprotein
MMKINFNILLSLAIIMIAYSCRKEKLEDISPVDLGGQTIVRTAVDQWILDSLTMPYNIAVKYRWDQADNEVDKTLTPADESKIIPAMRVLKQVWIDPYNAETGSNLFMKKYAPKQLKLTGSVSYQFEGTAVLGRAEGSNSVTFFDINQNYFNNPQAATMELIATVHHEFAHVLHRAIRYPTDFIGISAKNGFDGYSSTWFNTSPKEALNNGYITPYAKNLVDDDFAEMVANMLSLGKEKFDELVATANPAAQQVLRKKEQMIIDYFANSWNINFNNLRARVYTALYNVAPVLSIGNSFGYQKIYSAFTVDPLNTLIPLSSAFTNIYQQSANAVPNIPGPNDLVMDSIAMVATGANTSVLLVFITVNGTQSSSAQFTYNTTQSGSTIDYTYNTQNSNGAFIKDAVQPLLDYFSNNNFDLSWYADPSHTVFPRIRYTPQGSPGNYFTGMLYP